MHAMLMGRCLESHNEC